MAAVVLAPRQLTVEKADVHDRHLLRLVVVRPAEIFRSEKTEHRLRRVDGQWRIVLKKVYLLGSDTEVPAMGFVL